jgi:C4-dicarboxylate-specific signal transduction histidine kinase
MNNKFVFKRIFESAPSIKSKLTFINILAISAGLLLITIVIFFMQFMTYKQSIVYALKIQTKIIASNTKAALLFDNPADATEVLSSLEVDSDIDYAVIYNRNGLFASYVKKGYGGTFDPPKVMNEGYYFNSNRLLMIQNIYSDQGIIGTIHIQMNLKNFYTQLLRQLFIILIGLVISFLLAHKLFKNLLKSVIRPIINIAELMKRISKEKDYSLRTNYSGKDEISLLSESFNEMLKEIQIREEELREKNRSLQSAQAQIIHASRLSSLGEMSTGIAHEINQPLSIIHLSCESLIYNAEDGLIPPLNEEVKKTLDIINSQVERINAIITHLRLFARKDMLENISEPIDINEPLNNVFLLIGESLRLKGIEVKKKLSASPLIVKANSNMLEQVFFNIINNARDAMENANADKILTIESMLTEKNEAKVLISDTGGGIPVEIRDKIFEPFFTTKEPGKGTGLGLSISYGIVKQFGGDIKVEVKDNIGTTFILTFPSIH